MQENENKQELINDNKISIVETITPAEAGRILRKNPEFIRAGLKQGKFDYFGTAVQGETGQWNFLIIKSKFLEYIGLKPKVISILEKEEEVAKLIKEKEIARMLEAFPHL